MGIAKGASAFFKYSMHKWHFNCFSLGITKRHKVNYNDCEMLKAVYNKENCFNHLGGASRYRAVYTVVLRTTNQTHGNFIGH